MTYAGALIARRSRPVTMAVMQMSGQMLAEIVGACEALATHLTVVRPFTGMNAHMACEIAFAAKRTATEQTGEWPLTGVLAHMQLQVLLGADRLAAERTGKQLTLALALWCWVAQYFVQCVAIG